MTAARPCTRGFSAALACRLAWATAAVARASAALRCDRPASQFAKINGADPRAFIVSSNVERRSLTAGQKAIATALIWPEPEKGGRGKKTNPVDLTGVFSGAVETCALHSPLVPTAGARSSEWRDLQSARAPLYFRHVVAYFFGAFSSTSPAGFVQPARPMLVATPRAGPEWVHEFKYDGYRLLAGKDAGFRPRSSPDEMHDVSNSGIADQLRIAFEEWS